MATFTMRHDVASGEARFWELFFEPGFNRALFEALAFPAWTVLDDQRTEASIVRTVRVTPRLEAPAAVAKLLGSSFGYEETARFDKATRTVSFVMKTNVLSDKLRNEGTVRCEPRGEGHVTRVVTVTTEAKVFGLGGLIEGAFEKSLRSAWQASAEFQNRWLKEHP